MRKHVIAASLCALVFAAIVWSQAPTAINSTDLLVNSRATINTNFSNLYAGAATAGLNCSGTPGSFVVTLNSSGTPSTCGTLTWSTITALSGYPGVVSSFNSRNGAVNLIASDVQTVEQDLRVTASPTFVGLNLSGAATSTGAQTITLSTNGTALTITQSGASGTGLSVSATNNTAIIGVTSVGANPAISGTSNDTVTGAPGVYGYSAGQYGLSGNGAAAGAYGTSPITGVYGTATGAGGYGVQGSVGAGAGATGYGGYFSSSSSGTGLYASSSSGNAAEINGAMQFDAGAHYQKLVTASVAAARTLNLVDQGTTGAWAFGDQADATKVLLLDLHSATTGTKTTFAFAQTAGRTVTWPDASITVPGIVVTNCGSSASCATPTTISSTAKIVIGTIVFSASTTATVSGISPAFTSSGSYACTANDPSHTYTYTIQAVSSSSFTITSGTSNSDTWSWQCSGV